MSEFYRFTVEHPIVLILDDNMPLRSMRHEYYKLARKCKQGVKITGCENNPSLRSLCENNTVIPPIKDTRISLPTKDK